MFGFTERTLKLCRAMPDVGDFVPELICVGVDFLICGVLYKVYRTTNNVLRDLSTVPQINIDENIRTSIENHGQSVSDLQTGTVTLPYAAIRGLVTPLGKTVVSTYPEDSIKGVIQRVVFTEHKRNMSRTGFWVDSQRVLHQYTNDAPFCLINSKDQSLFSFVKPYIEVLDWTDADRIDLETVYDNFESNTNSLGSHIWGWVMGDMQKGVQKTEMMLTNGRPLTGVGQLVAGPMGVKLMPPSDDKSYFLINNSLTSLIKEYESSKTALKVFLGIFSGVGLFISGMIAWKYYKKLQQEREARVNLDNIARARSERGSRPARRVSGDHDSSSLSCVVCLGAEREVILLPCGHVAVCADCADTLVSQGHQCPVCRANIDTVMPAYVS